MKKTLLIFLPALMLCASFAFANIFKETKKAAEKGDAQAQFNLGLMYDKGEGVSRNTENAGTWYEKAAQKGNVKAMHNLGMANYPASRINTFTRGKTFQWFLKAAKQNFVPAWNNLGVMYAEDKNYSEAVSWFKKAAEQGNVRAQLNIGIMYYKGQGLIQDDREAVNWFKKAAEQGNAQAMYALGVAYISSDKEEAFKWFSKAAEKEYPGAFHSIGFMYKYGWGVKKDFAKAFRIIGLGGTAPPWKSAKNELKFEMSTIEESNPPPEETGTISNVLLD